MFGSIFIFCIATFRGGSPEWCSGLEASLTDPGSIPGRVSAGRDRVTHETAHINGLGVVRISGGFGRPGCPCPIAL
jgi:hypothetical protein